MKEKIKISKSEILSNEAKEEKILSDKEIITWQLKYISGHANNLNSNDLEWAIKMESSFESKGYLSEKEKSILEDIYKKC